MAQAGGSGSKDFPWADEVHHFLSRQDDSHLCFDLNIMLQHALQGVNAYRKFLTLLHAALPNVSPAFRFPSDVHFVREQVKKECEELEKAEIGNPKTPLNKTPFLSDEIMDKLNEGIA